MDAHPKSPGYFFQSFEFLDAARLAIFDKFYGPQLKLQYRPVNFSACFCGPQHRLNFTVIASLERRQSHQHKLQIENAEKAAHQLHQPISRHDGVDWTTTKPAAPVPSVPFVPMVIVRSSDVRRITMLRGLSRAELQFLILQCQPGLMIQ